MQCALTVSNCGLAGGHSSLVDPVTAESHLGILCEAELLWWSHPNCCWRILHLLSHALFVCCTVRSSQISLLARGHAQTISKRRCRHLSALLLAHLHVQIFAELLLLERLPLLFGPNVKLTRRGH